MDSSEQDLFQMECMAAPDGGAPLCRPAGDGVDASGHADTDETAHIVSGPLDFLDPVLTDPIGWVQTYLLNLSVLLPVASQLGLIALALLTGILLAPRLSRLAQASLARLPDNIQSLLNTALPRLVRPALWALLLYAAQALMAGAGFDSTLVRIASSLSLAWLLIRLVTDFLPESLRQTARWIIWVFAALYAIGFLDEVMFWLNTIGPPFGERTISPVFIVQAVLTMGLFLFAANWLSNKLKTRVEKLPRVEPSLRILMGNAVQIALFFSAALLAMAGLGIPLSGLAVLGGAIGVGLGFGMQQIVANFISGVILLTDRSIKPDDVIEVDETYGVVKSLGLRYASVVTRDGKEHLIPNEMLITDKVINWSFSDREVRVKRRLRVEYETDLRQAVELVEAGASQTQRVLKAPRPQCLVMEFGDEAIELEIRFWINDPENGISNVSSDVLLNVWDKLTAAGIDIPLRHDDVLITPGSTLKVEMVKTE